MMNHNRTEGMITHTHHIASANPWRSSLRRTLSFSLALLMLFAAACGDPDRGTVEAKAEASHERAATAEEKPAPGAHEHGDAEEAIEMTEAMMKDAGITVEPVIRQPASASTSVPGRVIPTQDGVAHVGTVVPGRIARLLAGEGSYVGKGTALAEIEAFDIGGLKGDYITAQADAEQTQAALARQEKLAAESIGAKRTLEEARASHAQAVAALRAAEARLRAAGINPGSIRSGSPFSSRIILRSPISGVVSRRLVALGEYLEPNKDAFEIVNTSTVWIDAQVNPALGATLRVGDPAFVRDQTDHRHAGTIRFVAPTVDPESRTITFRTALSNPDRHMRPESFVTVEFERAISGEALVIPSGALEQEGNDRYVYHETAPGRFERVRVEVGAAGGDRTVVTHGLAAGDRIAVSGLFYLKSARQKGELQEHE